jgi:ABC-type Fe3+-hydroxamate transport system substrate-binding protein
MHLRYVNKYLADTRWDIINTVLTASVTEYNDAITDHLDNLGKLVRKYERRRRWLKF